MSATRFIPLLLTLAVCAAATAAHPHADAQQDQPPTFRTGVQYVEVDVRVTDSDGHVVRNLKKEDFTLVDDGQSQTISEATF